MKFSNTALTRLRDAYANRYEPESFRALAYAYWHALLYVTILVVLSAVCFGLWQLIAIFFTTPITAPSLIPSKAQAPILNSAQLEETVQGFEDRREQYEYLKSNPTPFTDPSR